MYYQEMSEAILLKTDPVIVMLIHYSRAGIGMSGKINQHLIDDIDPRIFNRSERLENADAVTIAMGLLFSVIVLESLTGDNL